MSSEQAHIDFDRIAKYLSNEAGEEERSLVEAWIAANSANQAEFEMIREIWQKAGAYHEPAPAAVDPLQAWDKLKRRIDDAEQIRLESDAFRRRSVFYYVVRVAAAFVLAIAVFYVFQTARDGGAVELRAEGTILKDTLPDQTGVALNAGTTLTFKKTKAERRAQLSGEAFFDVKADSLTPFIVDAGDAYVRVTGTSFNLQAYPDKDTIALSMETGSAWLIGKAVNDSLLVLAGGKAFFARSSGQMGTLEADPANDAFWLTRTLIFKRTELLQVFETLEKNYQVNIFAANPDILNCRLSARYKNATVENILEQIAAVFNLQVSSQGRDFHIMGEGCD